MTETKSVEQYLEELEKGVATFNAKFEPIEMQFKTLQERIDAIETKVNAPEIIRAPNGKNVEAEWEKAFIKWFVADESFDQKVYIQQIRDAEPDRLKTLASDNLTTGGYWMPATMSDRIIEALLVLDPFRTVASVVSLPVGDTYEMLGEVAATMAAWTSERSTRSATATPTLRKFSIPTHPMYAAPALTQKMARMSSFNVEQWLTRKVSEYFAYLEGVAFIAGTGVGQPEGIRVRATDQIGTRTTFSGHATTIPDMDCLMNVQDMLADKYQPGAVWVMDRSTKNVLRKFTDGNGRYILEENVQAGQPERLFGKSIVYMDSMPTATAGAYTQHDIPILYGDMRAAYQIVDIPGMIAIRDEITTKGAVTLYTERMGVGGMTVDDLAFVGLEIDTA